MGLASAARFYFVTWIGERVVADLRERVFGHVLSLSPSFFETTRTGEVLSRLTADTTLIQTVVGSSASFALRTMVMAAGSLAMMLITSFYLTALTFVGVPLVLVPIILFGRKVRRLSRASQDRIADTSALAGETLNAVQTVQAFTHEENDRKRFGAAVVESFSAAISRTRMRAVTTALSIFLSGSVVACVLWAGATDVLAGRMTGGELGQFVLYAIFLASSVGALSEVWGDVQRAAGVGNRTVGVGVNETKPDLALARVVDDLRRGGRRGQLLGPGSFFCTRRLHLNQFRLADALTFRVGDFARDCRRVGFRRR